MNDSICIAGTDTTGGIGIFTSTSTPILYRLAKREDGMLILEGGYKVFNTSGVADISWKAIPTHVYGEKND